jgi:hypothetical protein
MFSCYALFRNISLHLRNKKSKRGEWGRTGAEAIPVSGNEREKENWSRIEPMFGNERQKERESQTEANTDLQQRHAMQSWSCFSRWFQ